MKETTTTKIYNVYFYHR